MDDENRIQDQKWKLFGTWLFERIQNHYDERYMYVQLAGFFQRKNGKSESADNWLDVALLIVLRYMYVCARVPIKFSLPFPSVPFCMDIEGSLSTPQYEGIQKVRGISQ